MGDTLLLFDIDGTLVRGSLAGPHAYVKAVRTVFGVDADLIGLELSGKTDLINLRDLLARHGLDPDQAGSARLHDAYLGHLAELLRSDPGEVCPGVHRLLRTLQAEPWVRLALGTGNLEQGARLKLEAHGLAGYFATGGFGSDAVERAAIIAAGIAKAELRFGARFDRVAVIGDTPRDIACAMANGVYGIGVATGSYGIGELRRAGAARVFSDFSSSGDFLAAISALPPSIPEDARRA